MEMKIKILLVYHQNVVIFLIPVQENIPILVGLVNEFYTYENITSGPSHFVVTYLVLCMSEDLKRCLS